ncbi:hypothetical protein CBER1_11616 [Cercospora berteroae]|uniref:Coenzyme Q-binding protein COQ10 START domain-containing protein n=1 Tax=Cercospora berteroae TaxID=357750 RepID=A0A2S6BZP5_9PEZI|nr:hypothetical protein CBER1_11616 [Cercospora berteroae]
MPEAYKDHQFRSNANTGPRPTPTIPSGGTFSVYAETTIPTPPQYPYEALLDLHSWRDWNTFNPDVLITKHPSPHSRSLRLEQGTHMTITMDLGSATGGDRFQSKEVCLLLEALKWRGDGRESHKNGGNVTRIRWVSDNANYLIPRFVMKTERVTEIEESSSSGNETCTVRTWITFSGFAAKNWKKKHEKEMQARIKGFVEDLRERCEALWEANPNLEPEDGRERVRKSMQAVRRSEEMIRAIQGGKEAIKMERERDQVSVVGNGKV